MAAKAPIQLFRKKVWPILIGLAFLFVLVSFFAINFLSQDKKLLEKAIVKGIQAFSGQHVSPDASWFYTHSIRNIENTELFNKVNRVKYKVTSDRRDVIMTNMALHYPESYRVVRTQHENEGLDKKIVGPISTRLSELEIRTSQVLVNFSLLCGQPEAHKDESDLFLRWLSMKGSGYLLTHQLWALITARDRGCDLKGKEKKLIKRLSQRLYIEFLSYDKFNDLRYEQAAILCYAGYCNYLTESFIENTVARHQNGVWSAAPIFVNPAYQNIDITAYQQHMSSMAVYALSYWYALTYSELE